MVRWIDLNTQGLSILCMCEIEMGVWGTGLYAGSVFSACNSDMIALRWNHWIRPSFISDAISTCFSNEKYVIWDLVFMIYILLSPVCTLQRGTRGTGHGEEARSDATCQGGSHTGSRAHTRSVWATSSVTCRKLTFRITLNRTQLQRMKMEIWLNFACT